MTNNKYFYIKVGFACELIDTMIVLCYNLATIVDHL